MPQFTLPFGNQTLTFDLDADLAAAHLPDSPPAVLEIPPIDPGDNDHALIIFTDATRSAPDQWFVEKLLAALPFPAERIQLMCAVGMHRASTSAEKLAKLGAVILQKYTVIDHDPRQAERIGELDGIPVEVHPALSAPRTLIICTGVVEPHQYAGYSGGAKTAVIGCGGAGTIAHTHGPPLLDQPGVRLGAIAGNPFQAFVRQAGALIGVDYIVNAIQPDPTRIVAAGFGTMALHDRLVEQARAMYEVRVPNAPYDLVIAGIGAPKDANLYQASRGATYVGLSATPILREGGVILTPAQMPEGAGAGVGERNFYALLRRFAGRPQALIDHLRVAGCLPGEQRAYMIAQLIQRYHWIIVGAADPALVTEAGLGVAPTLAAGLDQAYVLLGNRSPKTLVIPHALHTLPKG